MKYILDFYNSDIYKLLTVEDQKNSFKVKEVLVWNLLIDIYLHCDLPQPWILQRELNSLV